MSLTRLILIAARRLSPAAAGLVAALAIACGAAAPTSTPATDPTPAPTTGPVVASTSAPTPVTPPATPTPAAATPRSLATFSALEEGEIMPILATTQLRVGPQRVSFLLASSQSLIKAPEAVIRSTFLGDGEAAGEEKRAVFHLWPYGVRGAYSTHLTFGKAGTWRLDIEVEGPEGPAQVPLELEVAQEVAVPEIGAIPPFGSNKTVHQVEDLAELSSDLTPDPDLYQLTIGEAIISGLPTVIAFASPAFCTSPTCGPQVDTVSELKDLRQGEANFIHVELYDNPHEIQGDLDRGVLTGLVDTWGFRADPHWFNESWTFVLGRDGRIAHRYEGFVTLDELDGVLQVELAAQ